jgi:hypothetical protein
MSAPTTSTEVQQLQAQLGDALLKKELLTEQLKVVEAQILALRNVQAGINIGRKLAAEEAAGKVEAQ